jgi:hypothetical protein
MRVDYIKKCLSRVKRRSNDDGLTESSLLPGTVAMIAQKKFSLTYLAACFLSTFF